MRGGAEKRKLVPLLDQGGAMNTLREGPSMFRADFDDGRFGSVKAFG
jgi:hypothetical protein